MDCLELTQLTHLTVCLAHHLLHYLILLGYQLPGLVLYHPTSYYTKCGILNPDEEVKELRESRQIDGLVEKDVILEGAALRMILMQSAKGYFSFCSKQASIWDVLRSERTPADGDPLLKLSITGIQFYQCRNHFYYTKTSILYFYLMDVETSANPGSVLSLSPQNPKYNTPSTFSPLTEKPSYEGPSSKAVSEFSLDAELLHLNKMMSGSSLDEKENDKHTTDRFIPLRKHSAVQRSHSFSYLEEEQEQSLRGQEVREEKLTLDEMYRCVLLEKNTTKMFNFNQAAKSSTRTLQESQDQHVLKKGGLLIENKLQKRTSDPEYRKISKVPFKVLDAPNLQDDFYLNLLEWSSQNILSVALDSCLYFWNANNNRVVKFCELSPDSISSLNWNQNGSQIAIGTSRGTIEIWDVAKNCRVNEYYGHNARVSSVAWNDNMLASGSRDRSIHMRDIRQRNPIVAKYEGHTQEVCGLKWSFNSNLLASGGNDNKLFIWSAHSSTPICKFSNHSAAVKGIAWSPHNHGVLASGGGSADKTIKFWNTLDSTLIDSIDTGSQVCNLMFSKNTKQIVSTHGYSNNEIIVWKYPSLQKMTTLTGHSSRVLFLAMNPSGQTIVTGAGDETLRFWNVFPGKQKAESRSNMLSTMQLR